MKKKRILGFLLNTFLINLTASPSYARPEYSITKIEVPKDFIVRRANAFNDAGEIGGDLIYSLSSVGARKTLAAKLVPGGIEKLMNLNLDDYPYSVIETMSGNGTAVGPMIHLPSQEVRLFRTMPNYQTEDLGAQNSTAINDVNNLGHFVYNALDFSGKCYGCANFTRLENSDIISINDFDEMVGTDYGRNLSPFFITSEGTVQYMNAILGNQVFPIALNNEGTIAAQVVENNSFHTIVWNQDLGKIRVTDPTGRSTDDVNLFALNNDDVAIGAAGAAGSFPLGEFRAVIWDPVHGSRDLNSLIRAPQGFVLEFAISINENNEILAMSNIRSTSKSFSADFYILRPINRIKNQ